MTTIFSQAPPVALATLIDGVVTTGLRNLATNTCILGPEIVPTGTAPEEESLPMLTAKFGANVTANAVVFQCWFLEAKYDGSSWVYPTIGASSHGSSTVYPAWAPDFVFFWDAGTAHAGAPDIMQSNPRLVTRPAGRFKVLARNVSGQTTTNANNTDTILKESTLNDLGT